jgi:hypothetical protein
MLPLLWTRKPTSWIGRRLEKGNEKRETKPRQSLVERKSWKAKRQKCANEKPAWLSS